MQSLKPILLHLLLFYIILSKNICTEGKKTRFQLFVSLQISHRNSGWFFWGNATKGGLSSPPKKLVSAQLVGRCCPVIVPSFPTAKHCLSISQVGCKDHSGFVLQRATLESSILGDKNATRDP